MIVPEIQISYYLQERIRQISNPFQWVLAEPGHLVFTSPGYYISPCYHPIIKKIDDNAMTYDWLLETFPDHLYAMSITNSFFENYRKIMVMEYYGLRGYPWVMPLEEVLPYLNPKKQWWQIWK